MFRHGSKRGSAGAILRSFDPSILRVLRVLLHDLMRDWKDEDPDGQFLHASDFSIIDEHRNISSHSWNNDVRWFVLKFKLAKLSAMARRVPSACLSPTRGHPKANKRPAQTINCTCLCFPRDKEQSHCRRGNHMKPCAVGSKTSSHMVAFSVASSW
jgi:hypothetical protein